MEKDQETVKVDSKGRMVLPSWIRENLGLKEGGNVSIKQDGQRIVIVPKAAIDLQKKVDRWLKLTLETKMQAFGESQQEKGEKTDRDSTWMSRKYARRKLGLR